MARRQIGQIPPTFSLVGSLLRLDPGIPSPTDDTHQIPLKYLQKTIIMAADSDSLPLIYSSMGRLHWLPTDPNLSTPPPRRALVVCQRFNFVLVIWGIEIFYASLATIYQFAKGSLGSLVNLNPLNKKEDCKWSKAQIELTDVCMNPEETSLVMVSHQAVHFFDPRLLPEETIDKAALFTFRHHQFDVLDLVWLGESCYVLWSDGSVMVFIPTIQSSGAVFSWPQAVCLGAAVVNFDGLYVINKERQVRVINTIMGSNSDEYALPSQNSELKHIEVVPIKGYDRLIEIREGMLVGCGWSKKLIWENSKGSGTIYVKDSSKWVYLEQGKMGHDHIAMALDCENILTLNARGEIEVYEPVPAWFLHSLNFSSAELRQKAQFIAIFNRVREQTKVVKKVKKAIKEMRDW